MKKIWRNEEGVSPVIAVILMVAITVVLAAVLYVMVSGMLGTTGTTPTISMNWKEKQDEAGNWTGNVVSITGVSSINNDDVTVTMSQGTNSGSKDLHLITETAWLTVGNLVLRFKDNDPTDKLTAADQWTLTGQQPGDVIRLVYKPTGGQMVSTELQ